MKRYIPVIILASVLALSAPFSAHADGFLGLFNKDKPAEQGETNESGNTIYNRKNASSSSNPIFLNKKDGGRDTKSRGNNTTYDKYNRNQDDSADAMPERFREQSERLEAEEKARLAARQAERERIIEKMNKENEAWLADLERKEREEAKKREAEAFDPDSANFEIPDGGKSSRPARKEESRQEEDDDVKYIYKRPEKNSAPSRVFKDFR